MRLSELLSGINAVYGGSDREVTSIVSDSRRLCPGDLFVAVKGEHFDGHDVCAQMLAKGACAVVVSRDLGLERQILVEDTRAALNMLEAAYFGYPARSMKLLGLTGTSGKTGTAFMTKAMLDALGVRAGLMGTVKCMAGSREFRAGQTTPEPAEMQRLFKIMQAEGCEYAVMEVSSQGIDQGRIAGLAFESAAFTNFSQDHLDYHKTMQNYLNAKKPLFAAAAHAVTNIDDAKGLEAVELFRGRPFTVSAQREADLRCSDIRCDTTGTSFTVTFRGESRRLRVPVLGSFTAYNVMTAMALLLTCGFDFREVCRASRNIRTVPGRLETIPTGRDFSILLDYAHKPDALDKMLRTVREFSSGRLVVLFGCGGDRDRLKRPLMGAIAEKRADLIYVTSDNPRHEEPEKIIEEIVAGMKDPSRRRVICDRREAIGTAIREHLPGDVIVLAGKGDETYQKVGDSVLHFDEREICAGFISALEQEEKA